MTEDHPFNDPENTVSFLSTVGGHAFGAFAVLWLFDGAKLDQLPGFAIVIAFVVAMFAWVPIFIRLAGRLPTQNWNEVPSGKRWSEFLFYCAFVSGFLIWSVALLALTFVALDEVGVR